MGTYGTGNLENDYAQDEIIDRSREFAQEFIDRLANPDSRECDEYDYTTLFVEFEIIFALAPKGLFDLNCLPPAEQIPKLKEEYLQGWEAYIKDNEWEFAEGAMEERRQVISDSFDRLEKLQVPTREDAELLAAAELCEKEGFVKAAEILRRPYAG